MNSGLMFPKPEKKKKQKVIRKKQKQKRQTADGLMFPKQTMKQKREKREKSILHCKDGTCYLCVKLKRIYYKYPVVHEHHVYPGEGLRQISDKNGFYVYLCNEHHIYNEEAVHENAENMRMIQEDCQRKYEETHTRQQFMALIGRNYLEGEDDSEV